MLFAISWKGWCTSEETYCASCAVECCFRSPTKNSSSQQHTIGRTERSPHQSKNAVRARTVGRAWTEGRAWSTELLRRDPLVVPDIKLKLNSFKSKCAYLHVCTCDKRNYVDVESFSFVLPKHFVLCLCFKQIWLVVFPVTQQGATLLQPWDSHTRKTTLNISYLALAPPGTLPCEPTPNFYLSRSSPQNGYRLLRHSAIWKTISLCSCHCFSCKCTTNIKQQHSRKWTSQSHIQGQVLVFLRVCSPNCVCTTMQTCTRGVKHVRIQLCTLKMQFHLHIQFLSLKPGFSKLSTDVVSLWIEVSVLLGKVHCWCKRHGESRLVSHTAVWIPLWATFLLSKWRF